MSTLHPVLFAAGLLLCGLAAAMGVPAIAEAALGNPDWTVFCASAAVTLFVGGSLAFLGRPRHPVRLSLQQAFLLTALSWVALPVFAALPFIFFEAKLGVADAIFESVSGLTTTGSTVLTGLDSLPAGILLWRSILQWLGGVGIIVMAVLVLPFLRVGGMQLFHLESSDRSEKVVARAVQLLAYIAIVYIGLTLACGLLYAATGMSAFDALCHAMTTVSTGGYSTHDLSLGHYDASGIHWVAAIFMIAGALPFVVYVQFLKGKPLVFWRDSQIRTLLWVLALASAVLAFWLWWIKQLPIADALRFAVFNVTSVVTTTGYATSDYSQWGSFPVALFFILIFVGGCTGSTAGGIKIFRHQILWITARGHLRELYEPHRIIHLRYAGRPLPADVPPSVLAFLAAFIGAWAVLAVVLSVFGLDLETSISGAATALANVGPGLGPVIGPAGTFASLPDGAKWALSAGMLLGRLELFTLLVVLDPDFWRW